MIVGDLLVSSGLGGVYPPGYPVAKVTAVVRDPGQPLLAVEAEPLAGLDRDPEVLLVWFDNAIVEPEPQRQRKRKRSRKRRRNRRSVRSRQATAPVPAPVPAPAPGPAATPPGETP